MLFDFQFSLSLFKKMVIPVFCSFFVNLCVILSLGVFISGKPNEKTLVLTLNSFGNEAKEILPVVPDQVSTIESVEPIKLPEPIRRVEPIKPAEPVMPKKPAQVVKAAEKIRPDDVIKQAKPVKPVKHNEPIRKVKPAEPVRPRHSIKKNIKKNEESGIKKLAGKGNFKKTGTHNKYNSKIRNIGVSISLYKKYIASIIIRLNRNIVTPSCLNKRGTAGKSTVAFSINARGIAGNIKVITSSGNFELDRSALEIVRKSSPFGMPPGGFIRKYPLITIPFDFRSVKK